MGRYLFLALSSRGEKVISMKAEFRVQSPVVFISTELHLSTIILNNSNFSETHLPHWLSLEKDKWSNNLKVLGEPESIGSSIVSWGCYLSLPGGHEIMFIVISRSQAWNMISCFFPCCPGSTSWTQKLCHKPWYLWGVKGGEAFWVNLYLPVYSNAISCND